MHKRRYLTVPQKTSKIWVDVGSTEYRNLVKHADASPPVTMAKVVQSWLWKLPICTNFMWRKPASLKSLTLVTHWNPYPYKATKWRSHQWASKSEVGKMDGDPRSEPKLDRFSLLLPLPYRVSILLVLGMLIKVLEGTWNIWLSFKKVFGDGASVCTTSPFSKLYAYHPPNCSQ